MRCRASGWPDSPHPFTAADRAAGHRHDLSILQAEFSLTQMLETPISGRIFLEQVIRDNLDIGPPIRSVSSSTLVRSAALARHRDGSGPG